MVLLRTGRCVVADYHHGDCAGGEEKEETEEEIKKEIKEIEKQADMIYFYEFISACFFALYPNNYLLSTSFSAIHFSIVA